MARSKAETHKPFVLLKGQWHVFTFQKGVLVIVSIFKTMLIRLLRENSDQNKKK